ncbi:MAG: hypothetical protein M1480_10845 [Bacteroidetes bacterium]|nr:hypothetical protein [Bacteroidota bacterium]
MKEYFKKTIIVYFLIQPLILAQIFSTLPFITLSGNNYNIDVINAGSFQTNANTNYICWVNQEDTSYSIYVKKISNGLSDNVLVYTSNNEIVRPKIAFLSNVSSENLRIIWQMKTKNHWQIFMRELIIDTLTIVKTISDTLSDNVAPTISSWHIAWINNGNILYQDLDSLNAKPKILDSVNCSNPELSKYDSPDGFTIVYEEGSENEKQIYSTRYAYARFTAYWFFDTLSRGGNNLKPHFSIDGRTISYETFINGIWKAVNESFARPDTSENELYNCQNPDGFYYPVLTKQTNYYTPSFMVYDSDSLIGNKEIILKPTMYYVDSTINISHANGNDYEPHIAFY